MAARIIMGLLVEAAEASTPEVTLYTLRHPKRPLLPEAAAGAHVDLHLPDGRIRQYSLCGDPADRAAWQIAVKREANGGGAAWCHDNLACGETVQISAPRNNFSLAVGASRHVLVAGGIGVTPLLAMARHLAAAGADFTLHLAARSATLAPLLPQLREVCGDRLVTWFAQDARRFHPAELGAPEPGTHIYTCGPPRLMDAVLATPGWPAENLHAEHFQAAVDESFVPEPFEVMVRSSGLRLLVPADRSALDVLRDNGVTMPFSCEIGVCGACTCRYSDGMVIHRDHILQPSSRERHMTPCISRARGCVTLDL